MKNYEPLFVKVLVLVKDHIVILLFCPEGLYLLKGVRGKTDDILLGHVIILGLHVLFAYLQGCYIVTLFDI